MELNEGPQDVIIVINLGGPLMTNVLKEIKYNVDTKQKIK
jgi:hypothetical protein